MSSGKQYLRHCLIPRLLLDPLHHHGLYLPSHLQGSDATGKTAPRADREPDAPQP